MRALLLPPPQAVSKTNINTMAKTAVLPTSTINHSIDTIITLPKSKITIVVKKTYPANKLAIMDNYFSKHAISKTSQPQTIKPLYPWCPLRYDTSWVLQNQYEPADGKTLGIWIDWLSPSQVYTLGFREIFINNTTDRDADYDAGFQYQNMMVHITNQADAQAEMNAVNSSSIHINNCFIDEPYEDLSDPNHVVWSESDIFNFADFLESNYPSSKLFLSSYDYPYYDMEFTIESLPMAYVMCDQYKYETVSTWNSFKEDYGNKNISNWMSLEYNQSGVPASHGDFSTLFGAANRLGINNVWLFAVDYGNLSLLQQFPYAAWANGWLLRYEGERVTVLQNTDGTCDPINGKWEIVDSYYIAYRWINY